MLALGGMVSGHYCSYQSLDIRDIELYYEARGICEQVYKNAPGQLVKTSNTYTFNQALP